MKFKIFAGSLSLVVACLLPGALCFAAKAQSGQAETPGTDSMAEKGAAKPIAGGDTDKWQRIVVALTAIAGLLGTAVPVVTKSAEAFTLKSRRRKELQHIEDLAELMEKIKKDAVLSQLTLDKVSAQIEAEIEEALISLNNNRQNRQQVLESKKNKEQPDLSAAQRTFLLFKPRGIRAWIPHVLAYSFALCSILIVLALLFSTDRSELADDLGSMAVIIVGLMFWWFLLSKWALYERRRWRTTQRSAVALAA